MNKHEQAPSDGKELIWTDERKRKFWDYWDFESQCEELYFTYALGGYLVEKFSPYFDNAQSAMDFGSGRGYLIDPLIKKNLRVSTIEFSARAIEHISDKYGKASGFEQSYHINELGKIKKKFDLLFLTEVIEHLSDHELAETMKNIKNIARKGSRIFITTPHDEILKNSTVYCPDCCRSFHRWQHVRSWDKPGLEKLLANNGFSILLLGETDLNYEKAKLNFSWRQRVADVLTAKDRALVYKPHLVCAAVLS